MSTNTILYVDPSVNLGTAPAILKDCVAALDDSKKPLQTRLRSKMMSTLGFRAHIEAYIGALAPFGLTVDTYYNYVLNKDMAMLKVPFLIQILEALRGAPEEFLTGAYNSAVLAIYMNINIYVRLRRNTELQAIAGYEPPSVLPLTQVADAFVSAFRPILEGRIEESFESFIDDHDYSVEDIEKERELLKRIRTSPFAAETYDEWYQRIAECEDAPQKAADPRKDRNYALIAEACSDDDNYLYLSDLIDRRKRTFADITTDLREFRQFVSEKAKMRAAAPESARSKSAPRMLRALSRKSTANLLTKNAQGAELVQKSVVVSYLHF